MPKLLTLQRISMPIGVVDGVKFLIGKLRTTKNNAIVFLNQQQRRSEHL